jgi:hypothetical protein
VKVRHGPLTSTTMTKMRKLSKPDIDAESLDSEADAKLGSFKTTVKPSFVLFALQMAGSEA